MTCMFTATQLVLGDIIPVENGGFEDPVLVDDEFIEDAPGWVAYDPDELGPIGVYGCWNPPIGAYPDEAPEGNNIGWIYWFAVMDAEVMGMSQTLKATLQADTSYTLTTWVGNAKGYGKFPELDGFPGYRIELVAGDTVLVSDNNSLVINDGEVGLSSINYIAGADDPNLGLALTIRLIKLLDAPGVEVDFDDVVLTSDPVIDCPWDLDGSGAVGTGDLLTLFSQWGTDGSADFDGSGTVGTGDLLILFANWGVCK